MGGNTMWQDSKQRYGTFSKLLHWGMAILFLQQFFKFAGRINDNQHWLGNTFGPWHGSVGSLLLLLVIVRLVWAFSQRRQRPSTAGSLGLLAKLGHGVLYACMLAMPLTGIAFMLGNGYGLTTFGMQWVAKSPDTIPWLVALGNLHSPLAWLFVLLVLGHIAAALGHHWLLKDNTLKRML
ncbi:cytochrome b [Thiopseudomonas alkaliphila]|uniref:cytochrome b n=2 Tax=Thiopseudomonas alkaliphila TaxID=1697053 RepID=UPI002576BC6B|nr:cytochrome b [Thiopseudomonas alkaliphila]